MMNKEVFEGKWKQIRGQAKVWWSKLTEADLDRAAGKFDIFAGILQKKYGYSHQRAIQEITRHVRGYEAGQNMAAAPHSPAK